MDGVTWTNANENFNNSCSLGSLGYGNGIFVSFQSNKTSSSGTGAYYSTDGINWTRVTLPVTASFTSFAYGNGKFIAVCGFNRVFYSKDGITWEYSSLPASLSSVVYNGEKFVAIAKDSDVAAHSKDGINWETEFKAIETASGEDITSDIKSIVAPDSMTGSTSSTAGASGLVPAPAAGDQDKFLRGDGTWANIDVPDIQYSTTDLTAGTSPLATGAVYLVYE